MEDERTYTVYCHTNKTNGKKYVGITCYEPVERWRKDGSGYKNQNFYRAIKKYGWDNFEHEILCEGLSEKEACEKERFYIKQLNSIAPNGYNLDSGGTNSYRKSPESIRKVVEAKKGKYCGANSPRYGTHHSEETKKKIGDANRGKKRTEEQRKKMSEISKGRKWTAHQREVMQQKFKNRVFAEEHRKKISDALRGRKLSPETCKAMSERMKGKLAGEKHPMYGKHLSEEHKKKLSISHIGKPRSKEAVEKTAKALRGKPYTLQHRINKGKLVAQYTLEGDFVRTFYGTRFVEEELGIVNQQISECCLGKAKQAGGYMWRYVNDGIIPEKINPYTNHRNGYIEMDWRRNFVPDKPRGVHVLQYDTDGNLLNEFSSVTEASKAFGVSDVAISRCCRGKINVCKGFVFQFKEENENDGEADNSECGREN